MFRQRLPMVFWTTVETGSTGAGVPDSYFICQTGRCGWIEYKATTTNRVRLSPEQIAWHTRHIRYGGLSFIVTRQRKPRINFHRGEGCDTLYVHHGRQIEQLRDSGVLDVPAVIVSHGGPRYWDWDAINHLLHTGEGPKYPPALPEGDPHYQPRTKRHTQKLKRTPASYRPHHRVGGL